jgi:ABC-type glycerol-3-phosphate transport system permease component
MKLHPKVSWSQIPIYIVLLIGAFVSFVPFFWMMTSVFKQPEEIVAFPPVWIPAHPTLNNVKTIWSELDFARYYANSLVLAVIPTVIVVFSSALIGYVLAKMSFRGRDVLFIAILATMMIPYPVTLIPSYQLMAWLKWLDTYWALIIPSVFSSFGIFLVRQYMYSIPDELLDAGRIDGASELRIFGQLVLPLMGPVLAALGIFNFMGHWNSFIWPFLVLNSQQKFTLPLALATFTTEYVTDYAVTMSGAAISVIPVLIVFLLLQKQFVAGIAMTGIRA